MAGGAWSRRVAGRARTLRTLVRDTQRALHDVTDILPADPEISIAIQEIGNQSTTRPTALVILGTSSSARARLLHCLLGRPLLPEPLPRGCRWLRIQYGSSTAAQLTLGNTEFEFVEELESNKKPWDTIPLEDLIRQDQTDLATMLEIELNNSFLKDGLKIIVPPDIDTDPGQMSYSTLKDVHSELYTKRDLILKNFTPVYLYAVDRIGRNIFAESVISMVTSRSEEDFWSTFHLYSSKSEGRTEELVKSTEKTWKGSEHSVFTSENCLDLHQIKEIDPHSQVLFVLFSDSTASNHVEENRGDSNIEATESTEDTVLRTAELPESDQGLLKDGGLRSETLSLDGEPKAVVRFAADCCQTYLLEYCTRLSEIHVKLLQQFILASFDMARELQVVPKKIQYVARQEQQLYETINEKFSEGDKKLELVRIMEDVLQEMIAEIDNMDWSVDDLPCHQDRRFVISNSIFYSSTRSSPEQVSIRLTDSPTYQRDLTHPTKQPYRPNPINSDLSQSGIQTCTSDHLTCPPDHLTCQMDQPSDGEEAVSYDSYNFDDYEIIESNDESFCVSESFSRARSKAGVGAIRVENESELFSLSRSAWAGGVGASAASSATTCTNAAGISVKQASLDVQRTVLSKLSRKISLKLVKFVDCLKDTYFGTLQRCLESLESSCRQELGGRPASEAMRQLLSVARQVDLQPCASFSLLRSLVESLKRLFHKLRIVSGEAEDACCVLSPAWRRRAAAHTAHSLSAPRLAKVISSQILERLGVAHERYQSALMSLESALSSRLHNTEDVKLAIRKKYAPAFARLCLESTSMCDLLMYGTPELGREIGRGQYGVVYAVRGAWGGHSPVAVKSVLPADERHYHELAMEFFYTRSIPAHPRIVRLLGSVVQRHGASGPSVLLVSERKARDLHAAVRKGLAFAARIRISLDIVEGIRYLHSLGLVHRDIKMKNVLLDGFGRAALSDLGFCAAEALISGSVVGTPVHMAPELLQGDYDAAVDVYAFGVLFWYVCAGNVKLPSAFEVFQNKEQLWSKVKRGLRPERLPHFTDECWQIMESCWASEPSQRALLGDIQPLLERILENAKNYDPDKIQSPAEQSREKFLREYSDDDSLYMTGVQVNAL
ncbi:dual serine/threonine and tyrosine protein kinase-like isoform X2 [Hyposmocoma kahamanoa]|uniref:dual serine/threonine and tyrosine protein kinase-like isoform X2 n=1 Tax=Hyposmocoma kahamanoa TaxID=1477025 RepID=UPI000E6D7F36|nr:dual serine/threonine and tyrosine protein kinase-like isoform X2 [Hyposmocoma kahamanoa]